ncbi:MAG: hypothetical protein FWF54_10185 [Candidatus Azobacteroides sp.]|nr:hypothetical protein [Candidatus Azobacteroides sp.]
MKPILFLLTLMSIFSLGVSAQNQLRRDGQKFDVEAFRAEQEKIILQEVELTPEEARAFFPLYHEMTQKRFEINREVRREIKTIMAGKNITDAQYTKMVDSQLEVRSKEIEIVKEYYAKFKKILPPEKVFKISLAEMKMNKELIKSQVDRK